MFLRTIELLFLNMLKFQIFPGLLTRILKFQVLYDKLLKSRFFLGYRVFCQPLNFIIQKIRVFVYSLGHKKGKNIEPKIHNIG